jgi:hypothetical protein
VRSAATDIYVTCCVVGSALLAYLMIKYHQHVLFARSGALQYTKLGSESSRPPAGTALQPLLCEYSRSCDGLPIEQHLALTTESSCALARLRADAFVCGAAGGYTNLFLKGVAELVKNLIEGALTMTLLGDCRLKARETLCALWVLTCGVPHVAFEYVGDATAWGKPEVYLFIIAALVCATGQVIWINKGLAVFPAIKFVPAYSASLSLLGSTIGAVYFQEYEKLTGVGMIMWPVGSLVVVGGILLLLLNDPPDDRGYQDGVLQSLPLPCSCIHVMGNQILTFAWPCGVADEEADSFTVPVSSTLATPIVKRA